MHCIIVLRFNKRIKATIQGSAKLLFPGLENLVPAVAYHFSLNLPAAFLKPGNGNLAELSMHRAGLKGSFQVV